MARGSTAIYSELLKARDKYAGCCEEQWGLLSKSSKSEPSRAGYAAHRLVKEAKKKAEQEELEKVKLGNAELSNVLHFKDLGIMQSSDGDPLVAVNHRIA